MSRWLAAIVVAACWGAGGTQDPPAGRAQDPPQEPPRTARQEFMRQKLDHLNQILEGVLLGRHQLVADHAQKITLLTHQESWQVIQTQEYFERSATFRRTSAQLAEQARKKQWDAESLSYLALTQQCIQCHQAIRGADGDGAPR